MRDEELKKALWNTNYTEEKLSKGDFENHLLEQYKLYVEMADRISARRDRVNTFFITMNSGLLAIATPFIEKYLNEIPKLVLSFIFIIIILLLLLWWQSIISYRKLNGAKFKVIGALEEKLPARIYVRTEWDLLLEKGENYKTYWPLTRIESKVPCVFILGYTCLFCYLLF